MLKRISKIQGIGAFANCTTSSIAEFRKTTLLFGYNSNGKSTLAELFRSLESNDSTNLKSRLTIPGGKLQSAVFKLFDGGSEVSHSYDGNAWQGNLHGRFTWKVFDSGFINRNVISGDTVERNNKENFSKFILGENGVAKAERISELKQEQRHLAKDIKARAEQIKLLAKHLSVESFVALVPDENMELATANYEAAVAALVKVRADKDGIENTKLRGSLEKLVRVDFLSQNLIKLEKELNITLSDVHDSARKVLSEHVNNHMGVGIGQRDWIQKGVAFILNDECPFCEQNLSGNAEQLIRDYKAAFDDRFSEMASALKLRIVEIDAAIVKHKAPDFKALPDVVQKVCISYPELFQNLEFVSNVEHLASLAQALAGCTEIFSDIVEGAKLNSREAIDRKKASLFDAFSIKDLGPLIEREATFDELIKSYNEVAETVNSFFSEFKDGLTAAQFLQWELEAVASTLKLDIQHRRTGAIELCLGYSDLLKQVSVAEADIIAAQSLLDTEQSQYLDTFFDKINHFFGLFGSEDFTIAKVKETRGDLPVYILGVKYKNKDINSAKLSSVFSESDKRALALSIYWAGISVLDSAAQELTIAVMDDPVTSFDNNRTSSAIHQFRLMSNKLRQMVILSHYDNFIRRFLELEEVGGDFCLLTVHKNSTTSQILVGEPSLFLDSEHHKKFKKISEFIELKRFDEIGGDLRVYLEEEIKSRFRLDIARLGKVNGTLNEIINSLCDAECYTAEIRDELHLYREDLNPSHHRWDSRTPSDWGSYAQKMLTLIYTKL